MNSSDAIARLFARGCAEERRHRLRIHIPIALSVIMAGMCIYSLYSWYPYFFVVGFLCIVALVALLLKDAPPLSHTLELIDTRTPALRLFFSFFPSRPVCNARLDSFYAT
jgi:asparagine N-glycosylation enzyme membrane subunit Stt3